MITRPVVDWGSPFRIETYVALFHGRPNAQILSGLAILGVAILWYSPWEIRLFKALFSFLRIHRDD